MEKTSILGSSSSHDGGELGGDGGAGGQQLLLGDPAALGGGDYQPAGRHGAGYYRETDGLIHGISDAGIVYSPRSTYIFTMFYWSEAQLAFDPTNILAADISGAVYQK